MPLCQALCWDFMVTICQLSVSCSLGRALRSACRSTYRGAQICSSRGTHSGALTTAIRALSRSDSGLLLGTAELQIRSVPADVTSVRRPATQDPPPPVRV